MISAGPAKNLLSGLWDRRRRVHVGGDGFVTLGIACVVAVVTGGLSLIWAVLCVLRVARSASSDAPAGDVIIVLGGGLKDGGPARSFRERLERATAETGERHIVVLGGATRPGLAAEASVGREWLLANGVGGDRITTETRSRDTLENLRAFRDLALLADGDRAILVTNRFHLLRSSAIATGLGIPHELCAAEDRFRFTPRILWRVVYEGFFAHWLVVGRAWATLTRNTGMLERIT